MRLTSKQQELVKISAVALMVADHLGAIVLGADHPAFLTLRMLGRIAFPLFAFLFAYNLSVRRVKATAYIGPLAIAAVVSQPIYAMATGWVTLNIFFTLLASVLLWHVVQEGTGRFYALKWVAALMVAGAVVVNGEYGLAGILLMFAWVLVLDKQELWRVALLGLVLIGVNWGTVPVIAVMALFAWVVVVVAQRLPGIPRLRELKWFWYAFYPLHLLLFAVII